MFQIPRGNQARDAFSAIVVLIVCAVGISQTLQYPARAAEWPLWMWSLLAFLSVILLFNSLRKPIVPTADSAPKTPEQGAAQRAKAIRIAINIALVVGFVALVPILGFYTAGAVYLCIHMFYLGNPSDLAHSGGRRGRAGRVLRHVRIFPRGPGAPWNGVLTARGRTANA